MFRRLLPKEVCFFDYFEQHAELTIEACKAFALLADGKASAADQATRIKEIEHQGDDLTHRCVEELGKTFITPIDRTDIHQLITRLDDILDSVDAITSRLALYELTEMRPEARQLAEVMVNATTAIGVALKCLRDLGKAKTIKASLIAIHQHENEGDAILRVALARLFKEEDSRPTLVIKWKEIFERLERATDRCEEVANIIEKIVIEAS